VIQVADYSDIQQVSERLSEIDIPASQKVGVIPVFISVSDINA
jgi:hypothetical protein